MTHPADTHPPPREPIPIRTAPRDADAKKVSVGWIGSIALHALVLLIMFLLIAPADFGGQMLFLIAEQTEPLEQRIEILRLGSDQGAGQTAAMPIIKKPEITKADELNINLTGTDPSGAPTTNAASMGGDGLGDRRPGGGGPGGSFFGIEATGHEFVYVMDMSGSMQGRRYRRATDELMRSVGELREDQRFYVFLFSSRTAQMFGQSGSRPASLPATPENRLRLQTWLREAYDGGGTDPRDAVRFALKMNPSAVFILSDGEFTDGRSKTRETLINASRDVFSIVSAFMSPPPIHAVAFEDQRGSANLKTLAEMTGGKFHFEPTGSGKQDAERLAARAQKKLAAGDDLAAERIYRTLRSDYHLTEAGKAARTQLTKLLLDRAQRQIDGGHIEDAVSTISDLIRVDPDVLSEFDRDAELLKRIKAAAHPESDAALRLASIDELIGDSVDATKPHSNFDYGVAIDEPVAAKRLRKVETLNDQAAWAEAIMTISQMRREFPRAKATDIAGAQLHELMNQFLSEIQLHRGTDSQNKTIDDLRRIADAFGHVSVGWQAHQRLHQIATEILGAARAAARQGDSDLEAQLELRANELFDAALVAEIKRAIKLSERQANAQLGAAIRRQRSRGFGAAEPIFRRITMEFPGTIAADEAAKRIGLSPQPNWIDSGEPISQSTDDASDDEIPPVNAKAREQLERMLRAN